MGEREQYEAGIAEFNSGEFFECHDTLEQLWMETRGERRRYLQGLIHTAVGIFHAGRGNFKGADSQLGLGIEKLNDYAPHYLGVDVEALLADLAALRASIIAGVASGEDRFDPLLVPQIIYTFDPDSMQDFD
jgi:predicted metal-dependent hydrolase